MCNQTVGVAKRIEVEKISQRVADLVRSLDNEVDLDVKEVETIKAELSELIAPSDCK